MIIVKNTALLVLLLSVSSLQYVCAGTIDVQSGPYRLSGAVDLSFSGVFFNSCVPEVSDTQVFSDRIEFYGRSSGYSAIASCDFSSTPYEFNINELHIPVESGLNSGSVNLDYYLLFPGLYPRVDRNNVEISLNKVTEQYIYIAEQNDQLTMLRRSDFSVMKLQEYPSLNGVKTASGHRFYPNYWYFNNPVIGEIDPITFSFITQVDNASGYKQGSRFWSDVFYDENDNDFDGLKQGIVSTSLIYITDEEERYKLSSSYDQINREITVDDFMTEVVAIPRDGIAVVVLPENNQLLVVNLFDLNDQDRIACGATPDMMQLGYKQNQIALYEKGDQALAILDVNSLSFTHRFPLSSELLGMSSDPISGVFYVWDIENKLTIYNPETAQTEAKILFDGRLVGVSVNPEGGELIVFSNRNGYYQMDVLETQNYTITSSLTREGQIVGVPDYFSVSYWAETDVGSVVPVPAFSRHLLIFLLLIVVGLGLLRLNGEKV